MVGSLAAEPTAVRTEPGSLDCYPENAEWLPNCVKFFHGTWQGRLTAKRGEARRNYFAAVPVTESSRTGQMRVVLSAQPTARSLPEGLNDSASGGRGGPMK